MWIPVAFPNTMWMPVALPNDSNLRILRHIRAARAIRTIATHVFYDIFGPPEPSDIQPAIGIPAYLQCLRSPEWVSRRASNPAGYRDTRIYAVFALPRVGQQEGIHSTILSGSLHIYNVFCSPEWVSMVKSVTPLERNDNTTMFKTPTA